MKQAKGLWPFLAALQHGGRRVGLAGFRIGDYAEQGLGLVERVVAPAQVSFDEFHGTVEGVADGNRLHTLQDAFADLSAGQCGYCLAGILVEAKAFLAANTSPSRAEIAEALDGHLCRCGAHHRILTAIERAADALQEGTTV